MHSNTEENYLKAIYKLSEANGEEVNTNAIADKLQTKPASVTDMIKRLADKKLITYQKYKGVKLTASGKKVAINIVRKHRLWELFLVEKLKFKWDEVHEIAEQLEHIDSDNLVRKLDEFLGFPKSDPHGDPIPDENGKFHKAVYSLLSDVKPGKKVSMTGVVDHSPEFLKYLDKAGISLGSTIEILERISFDNSHQVLINRKHKMFISYEVAKNILVRE